MKKIILLLFTVFMFVSTYSQENDDVKRNKKEERRQRISAISKQEEEGVIKYKKHFVFGGKLTTDGYGGFLEMGRARSVRKGLLFQLEMTEKKHTKEEKQQLPNINSNLPLIYGKINFFYPVKLGVQQQLLLGNKGNKNGVSITANAGGGMIVGLLRPYMIDLDDNSNEYISFYDDSAAFLNKSAYLRGPTFGTGWNKLKIVPGFYVKPAIRFDYGKYNEMVNAIEVGGMVEYYTKPIDQVVLQKRRQLFISGFVAIILGRRK